MPPRLRVLGVVKITRNGSYGECECGYKTELFVYPESAYVQLATHMLKDHITLDYHIIAVYDWQEE